MVNISRHEGSPDILPEHTAAICVAIAELGVEEQEAWAEASRVAGEESPRTNVGRQEGGLDLLPAHTISGCVALAGELADVHEAWRAALSLCETLMEHTPFGELGVEEQEAYLEAYRRAAALVRRYNELRGAEPYRPVNLWHWDGNGAGIASWLTVYDHA